MINQNAAENELTAEMLEEYNYYVGQKQALLFGYPPKPYLVTHI